MSQNAIDYLRQNKQLYSKEVLVEQLRKSGYSEADIEESVKAAYSDINSIPAVSWESSSFWNFKVKRVYTNPSQKWKDFWLGFFGLWGISIILNLLAVVFDDGLEEILEIFTDGEDFLMVLIPGIAVIEVLDEAWWLVIIGLIMLAIYVFKRRRYVFYGMLGLVLTLIAIVAVFIFVMFFYVRPRLMF